MPCFFICGTKVEIYYFTHRKKQTNKQGITARISIPIRELKIIKKAKIFYTITDDNNTNIVTIVMYVGGGKVHTYYVHNGNNFNFYNIFQLP